MFNSQRWWIIGASAGLGRALAQAMDAEGASLVLSARNKISLDEVAASLRDALALPLDVRDLASVNAAVTNLPDIDGVIYCAGDYEPMRAQDWDVDAALRVADINYVGALRCLGRVVPKMAERGAGHVVIIGSLSGYIGLPGAIGYASSKAAVMHLAEDMAMDLSKTGVKVQRINPGYIRSRLTEKNEFWMPQIMDVEEAAARVVKAMRSGRFSTSFPMPFAWLFTLGRYLPRWVQRRIFT